MATQLHIGEVAKLLGITQKTIRHYHKVGLLAEPPRSDGGYRLYTASDLLRLQRIRRLQALGLSLKQIKTLLASDTLDTLSQSSGTSSTLEYFKEHLGEPPGGVSETLLETDMKIFSQLDAFNWPESYQEELKTMTQYIAEHPEQYQRMIALAERIDALASLAEDAPEVDQLIADAMKSDEMLALLTMQSELASQLPQMAGPFSDVLSEIANDTLSPAQKRF